MERREAAPNQQMVPPRAVLIQKQHWFAGGPDARSRSRCLDFHQRDKAVHFGFGG